MLSYSIPCFKEEELSYTIKNTLSFALLFSDKDIFTKKRSKASPLQGNEKRQKTVFQSQ